MMKYYIIILDTQVPFLNIYADKCLENYLHDEVMSHALWDEFICVLKLYSNDLKLLKRRLHSRITDETTYLVGSI